ncbi:hypothetical protein L1887_42376 [Cichorium endivia]|nr:hypothetical protein L1887_42376 [Cichorium endivia]
MATLRSLASFWSVDERQLPILASAGFDRPYDCEASGTGGGGTDAPDRDGSHKRGSSCCCGVVGHCTDGKAQSDGRCSSVDHVRAWTLDRSRRVWVHWRRRLPWTWKGVAHSSTR